MYHCLHCLQRNFFLLKLNAKIWVGRATLNREKKGDGLTFQFELECSICQSLTGILTSLHEHRKLAIVAKKR